MTAKFKVSPWEKFVRNIYSKASDGHSLTPEEEAEVLAYKNISKSFDYCDWFGDCTRVKATLVSVVKEDDYYIFTVTVNPSIPKHYVPGPSEILKGKGKLFPIGWQCI